MSPLIRKFERIFNLTPVEIAALQNVCTETRHYAAREDIIRAGDRPWQSNLLLEGMVCRYRTLDDSRRQILAFQYPGDIFDAYSFILEVMDHSIAAVAPSTVAFLPHDRILEVVERHPRIARALWKDTLIDASVFSEWMTNSRKISPSAQVAHLLCEAYVRFGVAGRVKDDAVHWPITLRDLSEALGLAEQIIADAMEEFRSRGWIRQEGETLTMRDFDSLKLLAEFDPLYLHLEHPRGPAGRFSEVDWVKPLWGGGSEAVP